MKKVFLMLAAVAAFTFVSCKDSKKDAATEAEGEKIEEAVEGTEEQTPEQLGEDLAKALESNDGEGLKGKIDSAKEWAQSLLDDGKAEEAKGVLEKIQSFLSENAEKVTSVVGDNKYVQGALDWVKNVDAGDLINKAGEALGVESTSEKVSEKAGDAVEKAKEIGNTIKENSAGAVEAAKEAGEAVKEKAAEVVEKNADKIEAVKEAGNEAIENAKQELNKAGEALNNLLK